MGFINQIITRGHHLVHKNVLIVIGLFCFAYLYNVLQLDIYVYVYIYIYDSVILSCTRVSTHKYFHGPRIPSIK